MLIRAMVLFLICCAGCRSGILPCPNLTASKLKKSQVSKRFRFDRNPPRDAAEPIITVSSDAQTPQAGKRNYRYVEYTIEHVDVNEMDCPKPGEKRNMPKAIRENIRKNRKRMRQHYQETQMDSVHLLPATYGQR